MKLTILEADFLFRATTVYYNAHSSTAHHTHVCSNVYNPQLHAFFRRLFSRVYPLVEGVHLGSERLGVQINGRLLWRLTESVELRIEHADYFRRLVVDDRLLHLVVEHRDGESAAVFRVALQINIADVAKPVHRVFCGSRARRRLEPQVRDFRFAQGLISRT